MLAYYVEWHMRRALAPVLFDDEDKEATLASRSSPVAKAPRSNNAKAKAAGKITDEGQPVHSFHTLMADLGALCLNEVVATPNPNYVLTMTTRPTAIQQKGIRCGGTTFNFRFFRARLAAEAGTEDERLCKVTGISTGSYGRTATGGSR